MQYTNFLRKELGSKIVRDDITLQETINDLKVSGNRPPENGHNLNAIYKYSDSIAAYPDCPVFYASRAVAFLKRNWLGDAYAALLDCQQALRLNPNYLEAHLRMIRALCELEFLQEAEECLIEFNKRFPEDTLTDTNKTHLKVMGKKIEKLGEVSKFSAKMHTVDLLSHVFSFLTRLTETKRAAGNAKDGSY